MRWPPAVLTAITRSLGVAILKPLRLTYNTDISYADRATINMVHNNTTLTISQDVGLVFLSAQPVLSPLKDLTRKLTRHLLIGGIEAGR